jgi:hypothetical protein
LTVGSRRWAEALHCPLTLSSNFLSGLLETDAIALHGGERHRPCPLAKFGTPVSSSTRRKM